MQQKLATPYEVMLERNLDSNEEENCYNSNSRLVFWRKLKVER